MSDPILASIVGVLGTVVGSLGGAWVGALIQRDAKRTEQRIKSLEAKAERFRADLEAMQALEKVANEWLCSLGHASSPLAAKIILRDKTEAQTGHRPNLAPSDIRHA
jgi:hypothetical protein